MGRMDGTESKQSAGMRWLELASKQELLPREQFVDTTTMATALWQQKRAECEQQRELTLIESQLQFRMFDAPHAAFQWCRMSN